MQVPSILQGESMTRLLQGIAIGAVATIVIGFYWGGWVTGGSAWHTAQRQAKEAVVSVLAPICVEKFRQASDAQAKLAELKKISYTWDQNSFIEKGGWAVMPGSNMADAQVAKACAATLSSDKAATLN
jgi:hypothetical protein